MKNRKNFEFLQEKKKKNSYHDKYDYLEPYISF